MSSPIKIVCIGDTHAHPEYDNKRFTALGQFVAEEQPDVVVQIGDWADMTSFNSHGTKLEHEGSRWQDDVEVVQDSLAAFNRPILKRKRKLPHRIITLGNHEHRIDRWLAENPKAVGHIDVGMLGFEKFGWKTFPFGREAEVAGFDFVHHLGSSTGRAAAISSPANGVKSVGKSTVVGHTHIANHIPVAYKDRTVHGLDLGCAIHRQMGHSENWSHPTAHKYRRCVWVLDKAANGDADFREVRLSSLGV
jgi:hypothetical protein